MDSEPKENLTFICSALDKKALSVWVEVASWLKAFSYSTQKSSPRPCELLSAYSWLCFGDDHGEAVNNLYEFESYYNRI